MPNHLIKCVGGPLASQEVEQLGQWFAINEHGRKSYSNSQIWNGEYEGKYELSSVYLNWDSDHFIRMYIWESNPEEIKKFLYS
ncbi:hypothetical protein [Acinetobacter sp.]|uniref:hypothetical protein n=1 Tax=Acinetobacter sp. TaxID=472 RepID=UPI0028A61EBA|nr:hypothetical protein [Acinetobacter sp.]